MAQWAGVECPTRITPWNNASLNVAGKDAIGRPARIDQKGVLDLETGVYYETTTAAALGSGKGKDSIRASCRSEVKYRRFVYVKKDPQTGKLVRLP